MMPRLILSPTAVTACTLLAAIFGPVGTNTQSAQAASRSQRGATQVAKERAIRQCVNRERSRRGLSALTYDRALAKAARFHASNMATERFFNHTDPHGRDPGDRVNRDTDDFYDAGENIAAGYRTSRATCAGWMKSPGHRANFLNPDYRYIGTGYFTGGPYGRYYVQVFALDKRTTDDR